MTVSLLKKSLFQLIDQIEDVELLAAVYKIISSSQQIANSERDWWLDISQTEQRMVQQGLEEVRNGETIPHKEVMAEVDRIL